MRRSTSSGLGSGVSVSISPAYHIPLSPVQLRQIGQLCAIQAQIEWCMQMAVMKLLKLSIKTTLKVMQSTSIRTNSEIWISTIREKVTDPQGLAWAEHAYSQIDKLSEGRNDFVHALYGINLRHMMADSPSDLWMVAHRSSPSRWVKESAGTAIRLRNHAPSQLEKLPGLVKQAAKVSVIASFLDELCAAKPDPAMLATLRKRLGSRLPPEPPKPLPKRGKGRLGRPQPSPQ